MIGIYKITDLTNNKVYIGQSTNIEKRWLQHKKCFVSMEHDYDLYFECKEPQFEVITECSKSELDNLEMIYIGIYDSFLNGFNMTLGGKYTMSQSVKIVLNGKRILSAAEFTKIYRLGVKCGVLAHHEA